MRTADKIYPDINFVETDTAAVSGELIADYETQTGRSLAPADPVRALLLWFAQHIVQQRVLINQAARQNLPRYAEGEYLDSLAELFNEVTRLPAEPAKSRVRYHLSLAQQTPVVIPAGSRVGAETTNLIFETVKDLVIPPAEYSGEVDVICQQAGTAGNGIPATELKLMIDRYPYTERIEGLAETGGGAEVEDDDAFYQRMRKSLKAYSTAGPEGGYIYYAKTASANVEDVAVSSTEAGKVDIRVLAKEGGLPDETLLKLVKEAVSPESIRPMTDTVTVAGPDIVNFDISLKYYIDRPNANSEAVIVKAVEKAIAEYISWQTAKMGRDINPSRLISGIIGAGAKRVEIQQPVFKVLSKIEVAVLATQKTEFGGVEDE